MTSVLASFGFDSFFAEQMRALSPELVPGRVVGQHRREWDVVTEAGTFRAVLAGKRWSPSNQIDAEEVQPTVGDFVALRPGPDQELGTDQDPPVIEHVLERRTFLARTSLAKRGVRQTLVANIDYVGVVSAFAHPDSDEWASKRSLQPRRIERYLTAVEKGGAKPIVVLNKADLAADFAAVTRDLAERLRGVPVISVSCEQENGLVALLSLLNEGSTLGLVGMSGVGKSSIVNELVGTSAQRIGAERSSDARGRHTTTHRELFKTEGGLILIDTPGMREFALAGAEEADLAAFGDISDLAQHCQFRDCGHGSEPGCRVTRAVSSGELSADRLKNYRALAEELRLAQQTKERRKPEYGKKRPPAPRRRRRDWSDE